MLYDRATIHVQAGGGGDGCVSFRREAHVPKGGPDGGDGGRGGDIVLIADADLRDLSAFRHRRHYRADRGGHGQGSQRHGSNGEALELRVPCGTIVEDLKRDARYDLKASGQRATIVHGGSGGAGNRRFATSTRQAPRFAERGLAGEEATLELRLKLLADIGLIGAPNAGKSSLLGSLTRAQPKIAAYPFTTLEPVLGTIEDGDGRQLVLADIPGLVEGAGDGAGLGHEFLAHVERTGLLVHLVDIAPTDEVPAHETYRTVREELGRYGAGLDTRPFVVVLSKSDLLTAEKVDKAAEEWGRFVADEPYACHESGSPIVIATSSVSGSGLDALRRAIFSRRIVPLEGTALEEEPVAELAEHVVLRPEARSGYRIERSGEHVFRVSGPSVERLVERHDLENQEALAYIEGRLKAMGVIKELEAQGFEPGEEIEIGDVAFALYPGAWPE
jgi:GTP-binding protein